MGSLGGGGVGSLGGGVGSFGGGEGVASLGEGEKGSASCGLVTPLTVVRVAGGKGLST